MLDHKVNSKLFYPLADRLLRFKEMVFPLVWQLQWVETQLQEYLNMVLHSNLKTLNSIIIINSYRKSNLLKLIHAGSKQTQPPKLKLKLMPRQLNLKQKLKPN